jgi:hydrogenase maturation protein HypF
MNHERAKVLVHGAVQGVGFRPFVYRLATELQLNGWVLNSGQGVEIEVEGEKKGLNQFLKRLEHEKPAHALIQCIECSFHDAIGFDRFEIRHSEEVGGKTSLILPDLAACSDCLREIFDPHNRRYLYPFTNCTHCGPRFSIIEALPYDRANTSMKKFKMCPECDAEFHDPGNRRFHAQPNACPKCGPQLALWDVAGVVLAEKHEALLRATVMVREGKILALKGIGGFQLIVYAGNDDAVRLLRQRKNREDRPFALMYPSLDMARQDCRISKLEAHLLLSSESPIVLVERKNGKEIPSDWIAPSVAPGNPCLGVMLPYTPLHHILLRELGLPVVATSGNLSDEPICRDEGEALVRLGGIADAFLIHDRPIVRHVDDSVVREIEGREMVLRRARGYAPLPVHLKETLPTILGVGAHLKNSVALGVGSDVFISQHIGDLETKEAYSAFCKVSNDLPGLYEAKPEIIACDLHPDYLSSKFARQNDVTVIQVQHHYAHVLACMAENQLDGPVLGLSWDGTGYGTDGTIWGGEFLLIDNVGFRHVGHLRQFKLPGGEMCVREPRRSALGLLYELLGPKLFERHDLPVLKHFSSNEFVLLKRMLEKGINSPVTSSMGRLFDVVASMVSLRQRSSFEGQAAMELEFGIQKGIENSYPFGIQEGERITVDWEPMILALLDDLHAGAEVGEMAARFHNSLAEMAIQMAQKTLQKQVVLTGGCFQNKYLTERVVQRLWEEGFIPYWHQRVPPNDGGIALGQVMAAARQVAKSN